MEKSISLRDCPPSPFRSRVSRISSRNLNGTRCSFGRVELRINFIETSLQYVSFDREFIPFFFLLPFIARDVVSRRKEMNPSSFESNDDRLTASVRTTKFLRGILFECSSLRRISLVADFQTLCKNCSCRWETRKSQRMFDLRVELDSIAVIRIFREYSGYRCH